MKKFEIKKIVIFSIIIVLIIVVLIVNFIPKTKASVITLNEDNKINSIKTEKIDLNKYIVDIKGAVVLPGVYELEENSRVIDVINMAGGLLDNANTNYINLSKKVIDEMVIIIYNEEEIKEYNNKDSEKIYIEYECICNDSTNDACIIDSSNTEDSSDDLISINNSTLSELITLPGIGESKANAIIKYRQDFGLFNSIEELKNVSGIGISIYEKIKDYIKL